MTPARDHEITMKDNNDKTRHPQHDATPWVSAEELQPPQRPQSVIALDEVDEALLESFPCSDPPGYTLAHA